MGKVEAIDERGGESVAPKQSLRNNKIKSPAEDDRALELGELAGLGPAESGIKGGESLKDSPEDSDEPWSLVDYLWKHRDG